MSIALEASCPVEPGEGVGPFRLGMSLHSVLQMLRRTSMTVGDKSLRPEEARNLLTQVVFSRESPNEKPIILDVQQLGLRLRFEPKLQRLYLIDIYDISRLGLAFHGHVFGGYRSDTEAASLRQLYGILGVTHSGQRHPELSDDAYCLQYPGLLTAFRVPAGRGDLAFSGGIPLVLEDGSSPRMMRLVVHDIDYPRAPSRFLNTAARSVEVLIRDDKPAEILFRNFDDEVLVIGETTCQDVLSILGSPTRTHIKRSEPVSVMKRGNDDGEDYFLNYCDVGVDLLFDGRKHVLRKTILRTNLPCHSMFGEYSKCSFVIKFVDAPVRKTLQNSKPKKGASFEELLTGQASTPIGRSQDKVIASDDHWVLIANKLNLTNEKPMVLERAEQPFGSCHLFGVKHCVFEIDTRSGAICSLTVS